MIRRELLSSLSLLATSWLAPVLPRQQAAPQLTSLPGAMPTDARALNDFAALYNGYVGRLAEGVVDLNSWRRVQAAWARLGR